MLKIAVIFCLLLCIIAEPDVISQSVEARKIDEPLTIDGELNEPEWESAQSITDFVQFEPRYGVPSDFTTVVKVLYDDTMIYFGIDCRDSEAGRISSKVTRRDGEVWEDDSIALIIDTFNDDNNAYFFIVNSLGTQQDERWADNGRTRDMKWDAEWYSAGIRHDSGWTAEIAVPFRVVKFDKNSTEWGFNVIRYIPRNREMSYWVANLTEWFRISESGSITQLELQNAVAEQLTFIPYAQTQIEKNEKSTGDFGLDARYNMTSNLGIDLTINPDFATIEADVEQINFTRFELSFPEKRPFFLEGLENYRTRVQQFYSRRIGEIPWGVKVNGKIDKWKLNALTTQSDPSTVDPEIPAGDDALYSVFRISRDINASNVGLIGANRNYAEKNSGSLGVTATLFFTDVLGMTSQAIRSYGEYGSGSWTYFFRPSYDSKTSHFHVRYMHTGEHVRENMNTTGFIRDDDRKEFDTNVRHRFWINNAFFDEITPSVNYNRYYSQTGVLRSWDLSNTLAVNFLKKWDFQLRYEEEYKLFEKAFRNTVVQTNLEYDDKVGKSYRVSFSNGTNFDRDFEQYSGGIGLNLSDQWNLSYALTRVWFYPDFDDDGSFFHNIRTTYYANKDLYLKFFFQSRYDVSGGSFDPDFQLDRETLQLVFVWRLFPPFGSLQFAYQKGPKRITGATGENILFSNRSFFSKISWVF
ncbi:DUF5916 domain-containing protein [candidate division KSB1 bacterium]